MVTQFGEADIDHRCLCVRLEWNRHYSGSGLAAGVKKGRDELVQNMTMSINID